MKTKTSRSAAQSEPTEANIRECAYQLYADSDLSNGHDVEHWVDATAILQAEAVRAMTNNSR